MAGDDEEEKKGWTGGEDANDEPEVDEFAEEDAFAFDSDSELSEEVASAYEALPSDKNGTSVREKKGFANLDTSISEAVSLADELVKTRIERIHEAGEKSVSKAVDSMETLIGSVIDSAETALKASESANNATGNLVKTAARLSESSHRSSKVSTIILSVGGAMLFISVAIFGLMAAQLSARSAELEGMVLAVGKRVVEMNVSLDQFEAINGTIDELRMSQEEFRDAQISLREELMLVTETMKIVRSEVPSETAETVGRQSEAFTSRISGVEKQVVAQQKATAGLAKSVQGLSGQLGTLRSQIENVGELNRDVEALVTLQRERYFELLQSQQNIQPKSAESSDDTNQVILRFPNPDAPLPLPSSNN